MSTEEADRIVTEQIRVLNRTASVPRPIAVEPVTNNARPQPFAYPLQNSRPVYEGEGNLDQARKAKNLVPFDPKVHNAKSWMSNWRRVCLSNKLNDAQQVLFFHECLSDAPRHLFDAKFGNRNITVDDIISWLPTTYPAPSNRAFAHEQIRNCVWSPGKSASEFVADFNHCFIYHPHCDDQTKMMFLLEKLPPSMARQARLMTESWLNFAHMTQWVVDNEYLRHGDAEPPRPAVNAVNGGNALENASAAPLNPSTASDTSPKVAQPPADLQAALNVLRQAGVCFSCGRTGHIARYCNERPRAQHTPRNTFYKNGAQPRFQHGQYNASQRDQQQGNRNFSNRDNNHGGDDKRGRKRKRDEA